MDFKISTRQISYTFPDAEIDTQNLTTIFY
jgi:hypothetical protein